MTSPLSALQAIERLLGQSSAATPAAQRSGFASALAAVGGPSSPYDQQIAYASQTAGVDPALVKAIVKNESGFDPNARSSVGAIGLMQLMPATAQELGVNPNDPTQNLLGGAHYIKSLLDRYHGDVTKAVAAYNAGPGNVDKYGGVPPFPETQAYVQKVLASYQEYSTAGPAPAAAPVPVPAPAASSAATDPQTLLSAAAGAGSLADPSAVSLLQTAPGSPAQMNQLSTMLAIESMIASSTDPLAADQIDNGDGSSQAGGGLL